MANCSDAYGEVTLLGGWTPAMCHDLNILKEEWASWTYSIYIGEDFSPSVCSQGFCGIGRWSFRANLESLDNWTREKCIANPDFAKAYEALTAEMEQHNSSIMFTYSDEESGCLSLCTGTCTLIAKAGSLTIEDSEETPCDYSWKNYLAMDFGGQDLLDELMGDLLKLLTESEVLRYDNRERVKDWAIANTLPHASASGMSDELISKFKAAFPEFFREQKDKRIDVNSERIHIDGHKGTWYVINERDTELHGKLFLLEHESHGDEASCLIVNEYGEVVLDEVWNGFHDYVESFGCNE